MSSHPLPHWGVLQPAKIFNCFVVLSCAFSCFSAYGLCSTIGMQNSPEYDACASFGKSYNLGFSDTILGDVSLGYGSPSVQNCIESVCPDKHSFCFPSTISGFKQKAKTLKAASLGDSVSQYDGPVCIGLVKDRREESNQSSSSDYGIFKLLSGGVVSCSLKSREIDDVSTFETDCRPKHDISCCGGSLLKQKMTDSLSKDSEVSKSNSFDGSSIPNVKIDPTVLDWGQKYLYSPSVAFLTVVNTCNDSILYLYEPFSNDLQFYPCNFSEVSLGPGESASICFVFFPRCLGLSSAHLILQTSTGGFIVEAKGYATESPFGIHPLLGLEVSPGGRLSKNFSLFNPFDETLYVEELTAWISVSLGHKYVENEAICGIEKKQVFDNVLFRTSKDRLVVKIDQIDSPVLAIKPHRKWEIGPQTSETLMEIDITMGSEGKIVGAFCLHLQRSSSQEKSDTIVIPIEAEMNSHLGHNIVGISVSATLEGLVACDGGETVVTISLRNHASDVLRFVKVQGVSDTQLFNIKYMEGLLLFPNTITQVGFIYCSHMNINLHDMPHKMSNLRENCKLVILTNDSTSPHIEIPCEDIQDLCFEHHRLSSVGVENRSKPIKSGNTRTEHVVGSKDVSSNVQVIETADVDEVVLENWVSQGTTSDMSVLEDHEVLFPMVQVGSYVSRWITVKNPSQHPVIMQLILNSGEIIDKCRGPDHSLFRYSSGNSVLEEATTPRKYGFSAPENAVTEAYVHPHEYVTLGPIIFYPSKRCRWSGSALIRSNLSGAEWTTLKGYGGFHSLVLLERAELIQSINFDLKLLKPPNFTFPFALLHMKDITSACSQPLVKELYAKNTGDLALEVKAIRVAGRDCGWDGFKIHACRGFTLEPGESKKLLISYQANFTAAEVHRDLELALATGILLIPMKASFPYDMLGNCKKSMFWMRVKRYLLGFLLVASLIIVVFCFGFPQTISSGPLDDLCKSDNIINTIKSAGKATLLPCNQKKSKLSVSGMTNHVVCTAGEDTASTMQAEVPQHLMQSSETHKQINHSLDTSNEKISPSTTVQSSGIVKASCQPDNLVVKTEKEKGRRRKKKTHGSKLTAISEVSSSQSGNSTPSSPLSPLASSSPKCNWSLTPDVEQRPIESHSSITPAASKHSHKNQASASTVKTTLLGPAVPVKCCSKNVSSPKVLHSPSSAASVPVKTPITSPLPGEPSPSSMVSTASVTLKARAPGSKLKGNAVEVLEAGHADEYAYDIWGVHLSGIHLLAPKNVTCMKSSPAEKNFDSFFVGGPITLTTNSQKG